MTTLSLPLLWLSMLCFACGQISDIANAEDSLSLTEVYEELSNYNATSVLRGNDEVQEIKDFQIEKLETKKEEKEVHPEEYDVKANEGFMIQAESINRTADQKEQKHKTSSDKPHELIGVESMADRYPYTGRGRRRPVTQRTVTASEIPSMSPERRNSYLSIAERRKYYNKAHASTRKPEVESENQERLNKLVISSLPPPSWSSSFAPLLPSSTTSENVLVNEIPVSRKPPVKDSGKGSQMVGENSAEKKNQTNNAKIILGLPLSAVEKPKKFQSTRQSVIQSQYEFGQKLNSRKPTTKAPGEVAEGEKQIRRNKDSAVENSTIKISKNHPEQSADSLRMHKNSRISPPEVPSNEKATTGNVALQMAEYVTINRVQEITSTLATSTDSFINLTSAADNHLSENNSNNIENVSGRGKSEPTKLAPFPYNILNLSSESREPANAEDDTGRPLANIKNVYDQEILRINVTRKTIKAPQNVLKSSHSDNSRQILETSLPTFENNTDRLSAIVYNSSVFDSFKFNDTISSSDSGQPGEPIHDFKESDNGEEAINATQIATPKESVHNLPHATRATSPLPPSPPPPRLSSTPRQKEEGENMEAEMVTAKEIGKPWAPPQSHDFRDSQTGFPLTIELNENNKRILSEMFNMSKTTEALPTMTATATTATSASRSSSSTETMQEDVPSTKSNAIPLNPSVSPTVSGDSPATVTPETANTRETSSPSSAVTTTTIDYESDISVNDFPGDDRKAMGTRYNTKFYISPNATRNHQKVIKVVETEDDDEEDQRESEDKGVPLLTRPAGITAYVLAAFGIVPLLLAAVFAAKFVMDRRQRRFECESDGKSDSISTSECQTRHVSSSNGKKKTSSCDLKKSPSNVTTTTLVAASRLPRIHHHWMAYDKLGNKNWEIPRSKLKMKTILGQGNFGQVWKAEVEDMLGHEGKTRLVAVKTVKEGAGEKEHKEFIKELEIMQQIGSHPNIVTLLGCCTDQEPYYLIMEYVKHGKLLTYLRDHRVNENYYNFSNNEDALTSKDLTVFAYCISQGMEYLVSRGIIHRDLAARNVLVDHNKVCKIADFGMSRSVRNFEDGQVYEERQHKGALPIRWMAPESLVYSVFTHKSDVWSFGIVMWEIVTLGSIPYPNMGAREIMRRVRDGYRLERPSHCKPEFYRLMSHCWSHDPNKRPDFSELREDLSRLLENPSKDGSYVDLDRFAVDNGYHVAAKSRDFRLLERRDGRSMKRFGDWDGIEWPEETKRTRMKRSRNNGKGTVTLTGQGSFTVNSRILEKEFKMT